MVMENGFTDKVLSSACFQQFKILYLTK